MFPKRLRSWHLPAAATLAGAVLVLVPSPAHAYQVSVQVLGAGRIVETTPAHLMDCTTPYSSTPTSCTAGSPSGDYQWGWSVHYRAEARPGYVFSRWESTNGGPVICDGANGAPVYTNPLCTFTTFDNLNVRAVFLDPFVPSAPSLSGGPAAVTNQTTASFSFSHGSDPTVARFDGKLDQPGQPGAWTPVGNVSTDMSESYSGLTANGPYTFSVRSIDHAGNVSSPTSRSWVVDTVAPPAPAVTAPVDGTSTNAPGLLVEGTAGGDATRVDVYRNSVLVGSNLQVGGGAWAFNQPALPEGTFTYWVVARDNAGNPSPQSPSVTVEIDRSAPLTVVTGPADGSYDLDGTVVLTGTSEPGAEVGVATDTGTVTAVTDEAGLWTLTVPDQADGPHTYSVSGTDEAGNVHTAPDRTVVVDTVAPRATAVSPKPGAVRVARTANVVAQLTEAVRPETVRPATVYLVKKGTTKRVKAQVTYDATGNRIVLNPEARLVAGKVYLATVSTAVTDLAGHPLGRTLTWKFRTRG